MARTKWAIFLTAGNAVTTRRTGIAARPLRQQVCLPSSAAADRNVCPPPQRQTGMSALLRSGRQECPPSSAAADRNVCPPRCGRLRPAARYIGFQPSPTIPTEAPAWRQRRFSCWWADYVEDYEAMVPLQMLLMVGHQVDAVCPGKKPGETVRTAVHDFEGDQTYSEKRGPQFRRSPPTSTPSSRPTTTPWSSPAAGRPSTCGWTTASWPWCGTSPKMGKPIASVCHGPQILAAAGVLEGRRVHRLSGGQAGSALGPGRPGSKSTRPSATPWSTATWSPPPPGPAIPSGCASSSACWARGSKRNKGGRRRAEGGRKIWSRRRQPPMTSRNAAAGHIACGFAPSLNPNP